MQEKIKLLKALISEKKNIVIIVHRGPDGDAMGSALGLYNVLVQLGHIVTVITPNDYASFLYWLPGNEKVIVFTEEKEKAKQITTDTDLIFLLDFGQIGRLDDYGDIVQNSTAKKVMIDHHQEPDEHISDILFSDVTACSTAQIVFEIIKELGYKNLINKDVAECLYTGIMTDTGSFKYSSTTERTHHIIAELIGKGAENSKIHDLVYDNFSENRVKLLGYCLNQKLQIFKENKAAIISLNAEELKQFKFKKGDTEGIVNYALSIEDIIFAVFIAEKEGLVKLSLRSKGNFKVNEIAKKYFSGGGHKNAAGGISDISVNDTIEKLKEIFNEYKTQLLNTKL
ncbi:MAG TPA: bifunctional oligoribonuclease/PAP phosphatase NrnA [Flavobacteriales bacterium]|nr:bifunctional oligoribonuclease/PAP phosphatase NrnA [Flavobacteriales bacterium]|tara:strand:+ start:3788 stop:4810 length:1023 start_codon:yes stop_codon:yes gene_type:complete